MKTRRVRYYIFVMIYLFDRKLDRFDIGCSFGQSLRLWCCRDGCDRQLIILAFGEIRRYV